jgi:hypothetical protein
MTTRNNRTNQTVRQNCCVRTGLRVVLKNQILIRIRLVPIIPVNPNSQLLRILIAL